MESKPKVGDFLALRSKSELDPTSLSELRRLKINEDSEFEVIFTDLNGISVRIWREGTGDVDAFMPAESWKIWTTLPTVQVHGASISRINHHAERRFPDGVSSG
jgi:hypothetical protein